MPEPVVESLWPPRIGTRATPEEAAALNKINQWAFVFAMAEGRDRPNSDDLESATELLRQIDAGLLTEEDARDAFGLSFNEASGGGGARGRDPTAVALDQQTLQQNAQLFPYELQAARLAPQLDAATFAESQRTALVDRAKTKIDALSNVDELQQIRREAALNALINAAQYTVGPDMQHYPGLEPGGAGQVLGTLLGASVPSQRMPRTELPVRQMVEAPILANENMINALLNPLLGAAVQPPRAV